MKKSKYFVVDCETGGLNCKKNPVTQIAFLVTDGVEWSVHAEESFFVKPYGGLEITKEALSHSMVSLNDIKNGIDVKDVVKELMNVFKKFKDKSRGGELILVGHNIKFDIGFLKAMFKFCGKRFYDFVNENYIDTMMLAKMKFEGSEDFSSLSLSSTCESFGLEVHDAHDAMVDVKNTCELLKNFSTILRGGGVVAKNSVGGNGVSLKLKHTKFEL